MNYARLVVGFLGPHFPFFVTTKQLAIDLNMLFHCTSNSIFAAHTYMQYQFISTTAKLSLHFPKILGSMDNGPYVVLTQSLIFSNFLVLIFAKNSYSWLLLQISNYLEDKQSFGPFLLKKLVSPYYTIFCYVVLKS